MSAAEGFGKILPHVPKESEFITGRFLTEVGQLEYEFVAFAFDISRAMNGLTPPTYAYDRCDMVVYFIWYTSVAPSLQTLLQIRWNQIPSVMD